MDKWNKEEYVLDEAKRKRQSDRHMAQIVVAFLLGPIVIGATAGLIGAVPLAINVWFGLVMSLVGFGLGIYFMVKILQFIGRSMKEEDNEKYGWDD